MSFSKNDPHIFSGAKIIGNKNFGNHGLPRWARIKTEARRAALGQAKLALRFQIPSQASSHGIVNPHRPFSSANGPASPRNLFEKHWIVLVFQAGRCCEEVSASPLARVFSTTNPAFAQRINPVFPVFLSVFIRAIRG